MNCKPGDLAVVVSLGGSFAHLNDRIVEVLERAPNGPFVKLPNGACSRGGERCWIVYLPVKVAMPLGGETHEQTHYAVCRDENLRPFRDPGEDAQDESLQWLPVPSTEKEAA